MTGPGVTYSDIGDVVRRPSPDEAAVSRSGGAIASCRSKLR
jgi:hypothetical protein